MPRYPVYVISKGRFANCLTAKFLEKDRVPYALIVEPQEADAYRQAHPTATIHILPFSNLCLGGIPARNWVWEHAKAEGHLRHWILDDNIRDVQRLFRGKRIRCNADIGFRVVEDFTDRYQNIAVAGMNYKMFVTNHTRTPFFHNVHVYSCLLIRCDLPHRWRGRYNEDTDLCLQVLADGWCTILFNAFMVDKMRTMTTKGGNMTELYQGDGRLRMARSLERVWPGVVTVDRRFNRPQHVVKNSWKGFDTPLIRRTDINWHELAPPPQSDEYGATLIKLAPINSPSLQTLFDEWVAERSVTSTMT